MSKCLVEDSHDHFGRSFSHCPSCKKRIGKSYEERLDEKIAATPLEVKQRFMDLMKEGKKLGVAASEAGLDDILVASQIFVRQIKNVQYLEYTVEE
jgi:hypothetical protein